jgi:hypothetical protein
MNCVLPAEAAREVLARRALRRSLAEWGRYKGFEPARHHQLICDEIESFLESDETHWSNRQLICAKQRSLIFGALWMEGTV